MKKKINECEPFVGVLVYNQLEFYDLITNMNSINKKNNLNLLDKEKYYKPYHDKFLNDNQQCLIDLKFIDKENLIIISPLYRVNIIIHLKLLFSSTLIQNSPLHERIKNILSNSLNYDEVNNMVLSCQKCLIKNEVTYIIKKIDSSLKNISINDKIFKIEKYINFFKVIIQFQNKILIDLDADNDFTNGFKEYITTELNLNQDENIAKNFNKIINILNSFLDVGLKKVITKLITKQKKINNQIKIKSNTESSSKTNENNTSENSQLKLEIINNLKSIETTRQLNTILIYGFLKVFNKELNEEVKNNQVITKRKLIKNLLTYFEIKEKINVCENDVKNVDIEFTEVKKISISNRKVYKDIIYFITENKTHFENFLSYRKKSVPKIDKNS